LIDFNQVHITVRILTNEGSYSDCTYDDMTKKIKTNAGNEMTVPEQHSSV